MQNTPRTIKDIQRRALESNKNDHCSVRSKVCSQHSSPEPGRDNHDPVQLTDSSQHSSTEPRKDGHNRVQSQMLADVSSPESGVRYAEEQPSLRFKATNNRAMNLMVYAAVSKL